jgi:hypothetical protein
MALLMVITSVPLFALPASADSSVENHLVGRYLVNGIDTSVAGDGADWETNAVGWRNYPAAHFKGASDKYDYLYISNADMSTMLTDASVDTGFTFAFKGARQDALGWARFFDYTTGTAYASGGDPTYYLFFSTSDGGTSGNGTVEGMNNGSKTGTVRPEDTWGSGGENGHNWVFSVAEGSVKVYRDGSLHKTLTDAKFDADWFEEMITNGQLLLGASAWNDNGFDGVIRDFRIYDKAVTDDEAAEISADISAKRNEAAPSPAATNDYWQIMGSTDFTGTTWTKTKNNWYDTSASPVVTTGDKAMTWGCNVWENNTDPTVDSTYGFESLWSGGGASKTAQSFMYLTGYDGRSAGNGNNIFYGIDSFKIDLEFNLLSGMNTGYGDNTGNSRVHSLWTSDYATLLKLAVDSGHEYVYEKRDADD